MEYPKIIILEDSFSILGLQIKTSNADEFDAKKRKIPNLWQEFFASSLMMRSDENDPYVYGVYSGYENNYQGEYFVTAGINAQSLLLEDEIFHEVIIQTGRYLVFEGIGTQPEAIINTWMYIWKYFSDNAHPQRKYTTDFEKYVSKDKVDIYIAVED